MQHFPGVGVRQVHGAGAGAFDLVQDGLDGLVLLPQGIFPGVLAILLPRGEVGRAADQDAGAAGAVAVVVVGPLGQAAGVAVQKGVQLVVVVGACGRLAPLHQGGGLVHRGPVAGRGAARLVVPHGHHFVRPAGRVLVDGVILHGGGLLCRLGRRGRGRGRASAGDQAELLVHGLYLLFRVVGMVSRDAPGERFGP